MGLTVNPWGQRSRSGAPASNKSTKSPAGSQPGYLKLSVTGESASQPIRSAHAKLSGPSASNRSTNAAGVAEFPGLAAGAYTVEVSAEGYVEGKASATVHAGKTTEVSMTLNEAGSIRQRICVADHGGRPLANLPYCLELAGRATVHGTTNTNGWIEEFDATGVTSGRLVAGDEIYELKFVQAVGNAPTHIQSMLNGTGWAAGPLDGDIGQQTRSALYAFQRSANLDPNGEADDSTVAALRRRMELPDHGI